jgi:predicted aldo/keto reductase-like oxidoreductase
MKGFFMQKRRLGRTEHMSTVVVFGGAALWDRNQEEANQALDLFLEAGVNHIDIAPSYGKAETLTGPWLKDKRDKFFLGCKTEIRSYEESWTQLNRSLELLQTDHFELYQLHAVTTFEELEAASAKGGSIETLLRARDEGITKFLGITGHGLQTLAVQAEALRRFDLDTVMFALNPVLYANADFRRDAQTLLKMCNERDVGVHIIKSIAKGPWSDKDKTYDTWYEPYDEQDMITKGVRFALSQEGVTCIPAAGDIRLLPKVLKAVDNFVPLSPQEQNALIADARHLEPLFT